MEGYRCIVWDWNGTLLSDIDVCIAAMNKILKRRELPILDLQKYRELFDFPVENYYNQLGFDFEKEAFKKIADEFIAEYQKESLLAHLHEECIPTLEHFQQKGLKQVILSASQIDHLTEQVKHFGIIHFFDRLLGLDHSYATSKMDIGKRWMKESGYEKKEVLLVGDTLHDYETACEIGCDCILLSNGHQNRERLSVSETPIFESLAAWHQYIIRA